MLRWFECENCYSFARKAVIEMKAREPIEADDTSLDGFVVNIASERILRVASIYGANASGKSNFIRAISEMLWNICDKNFSLRGHSFFLNDEYTNKPMVHKMSVVLPSPSAESGFSEYIYGYELVEKKDGEITVEKEYLLTQKLGSCESPTILFTRVENELKFGDSWGKYKAIADDWYAKVNDGVYGNTLFLRLIGTDDIKLIPECISVFYKWCRLSMPPQELLGHKMRDKLEEVARLAARNDEFKEKLEYFITKFDTGISKISVVTRAFSEPILMIHRKKTVSGHDSGSSSDHPIPIDQESHGTRKIIILYLYCARSWDNGGLLVADELDTGLHPYALRKIVERFREDKSATKNCISPPQLIFSSHNLVALNRHDMHMDGIYFIEKDKHGMSEINRLSKESMRPSEIEADVEYGKVYLNGRFNALASEFSGF